MKTVKLCDILIIENTTHWHKGLEKIKEYFTFHITSVILKVYINIE